MRYLVFLLGVLLISCNSNSTQENNYEPISQTNIETPVEVIKEEPYIQLFGFERFLFVNDSLGVVLENVKVLTDTYSNEKQTFTQPEKDSAYFIVQNFMRKITIAPEDDKALYDNNEIAGEGINAYYNKYGISIVFDERAGGHLCEINENYLDEIFYNDLSENLTYYIDFNKFTNENFILGMDEMMVTWMELADIILKTEDYLNILNGTKYQTDILNYYKWSANLLMYGTDFESIVEFTDSINRFNKETQLAYDYIIGDVSHKSRKLFEAHYKNIELVNYEVRGQNMHFMTDDEIEIFLEIN